MWKSSAIIGMLLLLGQGCAATNRADKASLVNLGNGICRQSNGLMWQVESSELFHSAGDGRIYAESLDLGGYSDWRLPSRDEYYSLCYIFELKRAGDCPIEVKGYYWTSDEDRQAGQWESYPLCGGSSFRYLKGKTGRVRAVRP